MSDQEQFFNLPGPIVTKTAALAITSTTAKPDLSADANVGKEFLNGQLLRFYADGADVYYGFCVDDSTVSALDDTATGTTAGRCACITAGTYVDHCLPWLNGQAHKYLYAKTKTGLTATLRIFASSSSFENKTNF